MQTNLVNNLEKCLLLVYVFQSLYCCFFFKENFSSVVWIYARKVLFTLLGISLGEEIVYWRCHLFTVYVWQSWMKKWRNLTTVLKVWPSLLSIWSDRSCSLVIDRPSLKLLIHYCTVKYTVKYYVIGLILSLNVGDWSTSCHFLPSVLWWLGGRMGIQHIGVGILAVMIWLEFCMS